MISRMAKEIEEEQRMEELAKAESLQLYKRE
jgi:hypothetical protein